MEARREQDGSRQRHGFGAGILLALIRAYQLSLSLLIGRRCRYMPSCSEYAADAVRRHGAWSGFWLGLFRAARCHPWGGHGFDPVPEELPPHGLKVWRLAGLRHPASR